MPEEGRRARKRPGAANGKKKRIVYAVLRVRRRYTLCFCCCMQCYEL